MSATARLIRKDQQMLTNRWLEAAMCSYKPLYGVVTVTNARSWDATPCRLVKIYRCSGGKYRRVRIQCRRVTGVDGSEEGSVGFFEALICLYGINLHHSTDDKYLLCSPILLFIHLVCTYV